MTPIAPHITAFLRERLPLQRGAAQHLRELCLYLPAAIRVRQRPV